MFTANQFQSIYKEFIESGLTIRDFCINNHISESKFFYWHNKLKGQLPPKRGFVPVVFDNGKAIRSPLVSQPVQNRSKAFADSAGEKIAITCEISYPNGVCLKLNGLNDPLVLRSLLLLTDQ